MLIILYVQDHVNNLNKLKSSPHLVTYSWLEILQQARQESINISGTSTKSLHRSFCWPSWAFTLQEGVAVPQTVGLPILLLACPTLPSISLSLCNFKCWDLSCRAQQPWNCTCCALSYRAQQHTCWDLSYRAQQHTNLWETELSSSENLTWNWGIEL